MSLKALQDYQKNIAKYFDESMRAEVQKGHILVITLTRKSVEAALNRVIAQQVARNNIDDPATHAVGYTAAGIKKAVNKMWKGGARSIHSWAISVYGYDAVQTPRGKIVITIWDPLGNVKVDSKGLPGYKGGGISELKNAFIEILKEASLNTKNFTAIHDGKKLTGDEAFKQDFSLSHLPGSTVGQMTGKQLRGVAQESKRAAGRRTMGPPKDDTQMVLQADSLGRERMWDTIDMMMADVLPASTYVAMHRVKPVNILGDYVAGTEVIELEFDERRAQFVAGRDAKIDSKDIQDTFNDWATKEVKHLESIIAEMEESSGHLRDPGYWERQGSDSRRVAWEKITEKAIVDGIVKGSKGKAKAAKKTQRPTKAPARKLKKVPLSNRPVRRKQVARANKTKKNLNKKRATPWRNRGGVNPIGLKQLIMKSLPDHIARKMTGRPRLQYQTGRFARSVEITDIAPMPNSVEIRYDYMQNPYRVFEPGSGSPLATTGRDPRELIGSSIREIAQLIMGNRFGLVRTKRV